MGVGLHGDKRVLPRLRWMEDRVVETGSVVLRKIGRDRAGELEARRFLESPFVTPDGLARDAGERTASASAGRRIIAIQDTTEINFAGRSAKRRGFGPAGNGRDPGFFLHAVIAVDRDHDAVLGVVDVTAWTRGPKAAKSRRRRQAKSKESARWHAGDTIAAARLAGAASVVMVADRESDIFDLFAERPARLDLVVRAAQNRALKEAGLLFSALGPEQALGRHDLAIVAAPPGRAARVARVEVRAGPVTIARPKGRKLATTKKSIDLNLVEVIEIDPPAGVKKPIAWRLLTTLPVEGLAGAREVIEIYRRRWRIEQVFRALKKDGLDLEASQITTPARLFNLSVIALVAATRTIQLVDARDGSPRPATDIVPEAALPAVEALSRDLEGATERQKNPHPLASLAFLAWVVARLGGWNGYGKPPGPKTMRDGLDKLMVAIHAYALAKNEPKPTHAHAPAQREPLVRIP